MSMSQHVVSYFAYELLRGLQPWGCDEVFVSYIYGWERAKHPGQSKRIKVCWLAWPIA